MSPRRTRLVCRSQRRESRVESRETPPTSLDSGLSSVDRLPLHGERTLYHLFDGELALHPLLGAGAPGGGPRRIVEQFPNGGR